MKLLCTLAVCFMMMIGVAMADVELKQGFVVKWDGGEIKNMTTAELMNTKPVEGWGKWNSVVDGWSIDAGYPFENSTEKDGCLVLGRELGTLAKYLPFIDLPFKDILTITVYPVGLYAKDLLNFKKLELEGCSGGSFAKATLKF